MHRLFVALLGCLITHAASAGRPLVTEDAGVLEKAGCEFESFASRATERGSASVNGFSAQVGCGVGWQTQVALAAAQARSGGERERSVTLGGKTALPAWLPGDSALTLAWGLAGLEPPGGSLRRETSYLNGVLTAPLQPQTRLHANLGWSRSKSASADTTNWALALEHALEGGLDLMVEAFATDRETSPWLQAALRWAVRPDKLYIDGSWGMQTTSARPKALTLGLKLTF